MLYEGYVSYMSILLRPEVEKLRKFQLDLLGKEIDMRINAASGIHLE